MKVSKTKNNKKVWFCGYSIDSNDMCMWSVDENNAWNLNYEISRKLMNYLIVNSSLKDLNKNNQYKLER